jgi:hypothetical protein
VLNYHGIAIFSTVGNLFELLVYRQMYEDLKGQLAECQHSFVKGRSTVSNLLKHSSFVLKSIEDGSQMDSIYMDFSKAFDKVRHRLLLDKMSTDVEPFRCQWLGSYFSGRIQRVRMGDCVSRDILVTSGVLQGSHLGPLCFIWFVNEIARIFRHVRVLFYADDMKMFLPVRGLRIQDKLNRLAEWCEANALELNVGKGKLITFSRLRHPIEFS